METIIVNNAEKFIKGNCIFKEVSFSCESGKIYGLIGKNGAGKTMLLKAICGLTGLSSGEIVVNGQRIGVDVEIPESVGIIIEVPGFLPGLSGFSNLKYLAGLKKRIGDEEIKQAMQTAGLSPEDKKHVGKYSLGMRQRLGIAQAIMEDPDILLLDEPMNGLDVRGVAEMKELLKEKRKEGKTILLASHYMEDVAELCDKVFMMQAGMLSEYYMT